eukprot:TRINITY_DN20740_c0_g1_i2.p1 TRINITY_DN20740_c0_g1~~TRINITY_DN20740_c0_g1_i2.p1  ORF type:complete len:556 (-),score=104.14 TRINITY_DN20740_c0_g1_i2:1126-2793(-)
MAAALASVSPRPVVGGCQQRGGDLHGRLCRIGLSAPLFPSHSKRRLCDESRAASRVRLCSARRTPKKRSLASLLKERGQAGDDAESGGSTSDAVWAQDLEKEAKDGARSPPGRVVPEKPEGDKTPKQKLQQKQPSQKASRLFAALRSLSVDPAAQHTWCAALLAWENIKDAAVTLEADVCADVVQACARGRQPVHALAVFEEGRRAGAVSPRMYAAASKAATAAKDMEAAVNILQLMAADACELDLVAVSRAMDACKRIGYWEWSLELLRRLPAWALQPDAIAFNICMKAAAQAQAVQPALDLLEAMAESSVEVDLIAVSTAMDACRRSGQWFQTIQLLSRLPLWSLQPDAIAFNICISALGQGQQHQCAVDMLAVMDERGVAPDVVSYAAVMAACANSGRSEEALFLFKQMKQRGLQPNIVVYGSVINAASAQGQWSWALALLEDLQDAKLTPNLITFNAVLNACEKGKRWQATRRCLQLHLECFSWRGSVRDNFSIRSLVRIMRCTTQSCCTDGGLAIGTSAAWGCSPLNVWDGGGAARMSQSESVEWRTSVG